MSMSLAEWDEKVGRHLHAIEHHADMCERAANCLAFQPEFETIALDELKHAEATLVIALAKIKNSIRRYAEAKPHG